MIWSIRLYRRRLRESEEIPIALRQRPGSHLRRQPQTFEIIDANPRAVEVYDTAGRS
jgi:hypothetical protein